MVRDHHYRSILAAGIAAAAVMAMSGTAEAAPASYQAAVLADNPYVYYRLGESTGTVATDASGNGRHGTFLNSPTLGATGFGAGSDSAVLFDGTDNQVLAASINSFGSLIGSSSYEFLFKVNPGAPTTIQSLFGVYSKAANLPDVNIDLNSNGNDAGAANNVPGNTRIFIRGNNADANSGASWAGHFTNPTLYDGNYHHLVFVYDASQAGPDAFKAYVDGIPQSVTFTQVNGTIAPAGFSDLDVPAVWAGRNVRVDPLTDAGVNREAAVTIDETALYGTILTPEQVAAHAAAAGFVVPEPMSSALVGGAATVLLGMRRRVASRG